MVAIPSVPPTAAAQRDSGELQPITDGSGIVQIARMIMNYLTG
jgi:hypothetical protein